MANPFYEKHPENRFHTGSPKEDPAWSLMSDSDRALQSWALSSKMNTTVASPKVATPTGRLHRRMSALFGRGHDGPVSKTALPSSASNKDVPASPKQMLSPEDDELLSFDGFGARELAYLRTGVDTAIRTKAEHAQVAHRLAVIGAALEDPKTAQHVQAYRRAHLKLKRLENVKQRIASAQQRQKLFRYLNLLPQETASPGEETPLRSDSSKATLPYIGAREMCEQSSPVLSMRYPSYKQPRLFSPIEIALLKEVKRLRRRLRACTGKETDGKYDNGSPCPVGGGVPANMPTDAHPADPAARMAESKLELEKVEAVGADDRVKVHGAPEPGYITLGMSGGDGSEDSLGMMHLGEGLYGTFS